MDTQARAEKIVAAAMARPGDWPALKTDVHIEIETVKTEERELVLQVLAEVATNMPEEWQLVQLVRAKVLAKGNAPVDPPIASHTITQREGFRITQEKLEKSKDDYIAFMEGYVKRLEAGAETRDALISEQRDMIRLQHEQVHSHRQWSAHERALMKASESRAIEQRAFLWYILERSEKAKDWLRLWEVLPQAQKDVYMAEAAEWLKSNPGVVPGDLRAALLDAPKRGLCSEAHQDDPSQERRIFCTRCGAYLGAIDLVSGKLVLWDKDLKVVQKP